MKIVEIEIKGTSIILVNDKGERFEQTIPKDGKIFVPPNFEEKTTAYLKNLKKDSVFAKRPFSPKQPINEGSWFKPA